MPKKQSATSSAAYATSLEHRRLLNHPPGFRPFLGTDVFERIGGQPAVNMLVDHLYEAIESDEQLRPLFPRDLANGRSMQKLFFAEWLGGPGGYGERAYAGLQQRHSGRPITPSLAGRWLDHFRRAMEATIADENDRRTIFAQVHPLAMTLVSRQTAPRGAGSHNESELAWCGVGARPVARATDFARRGDATGLGAALAEGPGLLDPSFSPLIMQAAALAGRTAIVRMLLDRGVGADRPFFLPVGVTGRAFERVIFVTPLCAARMKRRSEVESLLLAAGAREDVFTAALVGDLASLAEMLARDPDLAHATDPAVDVLDVTLADHAVVGGQAAALRLILDHLEPPLPGGGVRALRGAAALGSTAMVEMLLAHGANAGRIGVGRWVLHPELAPLLASHGAKIDSSGSWIGASCTGNQGRKDDPDYVRALLRYGARASDRRIGPPGGTGVRALNATALHYAAKAGFLNTVEVLLEHGADPDARDSRGRTPLDWLEQAAPSVSRAAVRNLIGPTQESG